MATKFDPKKHHRHSIRLKAYDYTQSSAYYITIVTYQRGHFFGGVVNDEMWLNELGQTPCKINGVQFCGSEIITNISFETRRIYRQNAIIF
jgi:hypothetical protein